MEEGARFCAGCGTPAIAPQAPERPQSQPVKRTFIGSTPQEKLATIKYVHKRANIIGLVTGVLFTMLSATMYASYAGIWAYVLPLPISLVAMRALVWGYYWIGGKSRLIAIVKIAQSSVTYSTHYRESMIDEPGIITKETVKDTSVRNFVLFFILLPIVSYVGLYYAIKHFMLYFVLKAKIKKEDAAFKKEVEDLDQQIDIIAKQLVTEQRPKQ